MKPEFVDNRNVVKCGPMPQSEKDDMIAELDAVVAHLYGPTEDHVRYIFGMFHEGWDYRACLDVVLKYFHSLVDIARDIGE